MTSRIELVIDGRCERLAELFADPQNNLRWMHELDRVEPVSGELGQPGSVYRMVPRQGKMVFIAKVLKRALPAELRLSLHSQRVSVLITDRFIELSAYKTKLISEEVFTFKGLFGRITGLLARRSIKGAHRRHMESFKRFAETQVS